MSYLGSSANGIRGSGDHFLMGAFGLLPSVDDRILLKIGSSVNGIAALPP